MIRLLGGGLVAAGAVLLAWTTDREMRGRVRDLDDLAGALAQMARELDCRLTPLPELLREAAHCAHGPVRELFSRAAEGAHSPTGRPFGRIWADALACAPLRLTREDRAVLESLGRILGRYDGPSQSEALRHAAGQLERLRDAAAERHRRAGRVYTALSLTAGAFLLILLM